MNAVEIHRTDWMVFVHGQIARGSKDLPCAGIDDSDARPHQRAFLEKAELSRSVQPPISFRKPHAVDVADLTGQVEKAKAILEGARRVAQNTPIQLEAARTTEQQATARYRAGLGNITEVAEAQRLLTQAEIDDSLARLGIWRALLGLAAVEGDLTPFLAAAGK